MSDRPSWDDLGSDDDRPKAPKAPPPAPAPTTSDDIWGSDDPKPRPRRRTTRLSDDRGAVGVTADSSPDDGDDGDGDDERAEKRSATRRRSGAGQSDKRTADKRTADKRKADKRKAEKSKADKNKAKEAKAAKRAAEKSKAEKTKAEKRKAEKAKATKRKAEKGEAAKGEADESRLEETEKGREEAERDAAALRSAQPADTPAITYTDLVSGTDEGGQQLSLRADVPARERMRELGAVLRMSETDAAALAELPEDPDEDQTMIINMGPQHPSTHGVLRLMLELQGETVLRCKPIIGYLHTGMEKTGEQLTYMQGGTNVTRMDYLSPFANELVFSMATERLLGIDGEIPERAVWIRMLMAELNRMSSHLLFMATNGMDLGAVSMMIYGWREREEVLRFFQEVTGLRMNHNYIRPGGVAVDLPAGWRDGVLRLLDLIPPRLDEYDTLMTGQPIWRERLQGVGVITPSEAVALGVTGPILRATGVEWDLRRHMPYLHYDELDFDVVVGTYGDAFDRYAIRLAEIRESMRLVAQILDRMPGGDYRIQDKKVTPPPRARIDESMEALIHHFKLFTEGFKVPEGEVYVGIESPRGEVGCYIASDGGPTPYRMHVRAPSFANIQCLPHMMRGGLVADAVAIISSVDPVLGDVDR